MAAKDRSLDVWLLDLKKVYTGVPFTVVTDWLQQGRLLPSDCVRLAGKEKWHAIDKVPALTPYLPKQQRSPSRIAPRRWSQSIWVSKVRGSSKARTKTLT